MPTQKNSIDKFIREVDFDKLYDLVATVIVDAEKGEVLMVGFMNEEALRKTLREGKVTFFSRTRQTLWTKGETSGNFQFVKEIWIDCDNDTLLIKVEQVGNTCHTGQKTCFWKRWSP
jgi:phosphoribosyl-AMP cyclohydrolase